MQGEARKQKELAEKERTRKAREKAQKGEVRKERERGKRRELTPKRSILFSSASMLPASVPDQPRPITTCARRRCSCEHINDHIQTFRPLQALCETRTLKSQPQKHAKLQQPPKIPNKSHVITPLPLPRHAPASHCQLCRVFSALSKAFAALLRRICLSFQRRIQRLGGKAPAGQGPGLSGGLPAAQFGWDVSPLQQ